MHLERIGLLRQQLKLTEKEVAKKLILPKGKYVAYERGKKAVPIEVIIKICDLYNVSVDWLVEHDHKVNMGLAYVIDYILYTLNAEKCFVNVGEMKLYLDVVCSNYHMDYFHIIPLEIPFEDYIYYIDLRNFCVKNMSDNFVGKKEGKLYSFGLDYAFSNNWAAFEIKRTDWYDPRTTVLVNFITKETHECLKLQQRELSNWVLKNKKNNK